MLDEFVTIFDDSCSRTPETQRLLQEIKDTWETFGSNILYDMRMSVRFDQHVNDAVRPRFVHFWKSTVRQYLAKHMTSQIPNTIFSKYLTKMQKHFQRAIDYHCDLDDLLQTQKHRKTQAKQEYDFYTPLCVDLTQKAVHSFRMAKYAFLHAIEVIRTQSIHIQPNTITQPVVESKNMPGVSDSVEIDNATSSIG